MCRWSAGMMCKAKEHSVKESSAEQVVNPMFLLFRTLMCLEYSFKFITGSILFLKAVIAYCLSRRRRRCDCSSMTGELWFHVRESYQCCYPFRTTETAVSEKLNFLSSIDKKLCTSSLVVLLGEKASAGMSHLCRLLWTEVAYNW